jgi:hypothetical protein
MLDRCGEDGMILMTNAKLSYPDQAHKLWCDVDGEDGRS